MTTIFDNSSVELFSKIIKDNLEFISQRNQQNYKEIVDNLVRIIDSLDSSSIYPVSSNSDIS